jgi:tripartite-type tricarboxylate transporter receptor subunit TctC
VRLARGFYRPSLLPPISGFTTGLPLQQRATTALVNAFEARRSPLAVSPAFSQSKQAGRIEPRQLCEGIAWLAVAQQKHGYSGQSAFARRIKKPGRDREGTMNPTRRHVLRLAAGVAALPVLPRIAHSQVYPNRIVRMVVGFPPGGGADAVTRIVASRLSELWGQQVVVENKPGAGSNLALDNVANATPDGYTIIMSVRAPGLSRFLFSSLSYDPNSFAPVSRIGTYTHLLVVPKDHPAKTMADFIAHAKANPGKVTFATPGVGTPSHLTAELLKTRGGFEMTHVPYRGVAAGAMSDLIAGRIDAMMNTTGSLLQSARSGQVRGLAVTAANRSALAPEFPTMAESGVANFDISSWYALFMPGKTPPEIVRKINADMVTLLAEPAIKARLAPLGIEAASSTPAQLAAEAKAETELWGPVIKAANIKGD